MVVDSKWVEPENTVVGMVEPGNTVVGNNG
jgi:hypothetical protein